MPATATSRIRALKQEYNTNPESWGGELNSGALDMLDEAWGLSEITVAAEVTLTSDDFISNESRSFVLECTGAGGFAIIAPVVEKPYFVVNDCSADITIKPAGGSAATVRAGTTAFVYMNGTSARAIDPTLDKIKTAAAAVALGGQKLTGVGTATAATDAATLSNKVHEFAAPTAPLAMNAQRITGVADPVDAQDVATKNWFDTTYSTLAGITADVVTVSGIAADVTTVAADGADIGTVAGISADVTTVAGIAANVTTVAGISADVTTVAADGTDIGKVAVIDADVSAVAAIDANVTTVAGISANVTTVAGISANVTTVAGLSSADLAAVAAIDADVTTVAGISADVTTAAANVADITNFADVYLGAAASDPATRADASALVAGDLYFNTASDALFVYDGAAWQAAALDASSFVPTSRTLTAGTGLTGGGDLSTNRTLAVDVATDTNLRAATANKIADAAGLVSAAAPVTLTDGATITPDFTAGRIFTVTLGGNRTLANATNQAAGQSGIIIVKQDATGSRTLSYGDEYIFAGGAPTLSTAANSIDVISYYVEASGTILCTYSGEFA